MYDGFLLCPKSSLRPMQCKTRLAWHHPTSHGSNPLMPPTHFLKRDLRKRLVCQPLSSASLLQPYLHVLALTLALVFLVLIQLGHLVPSLVSRSKAILSIRGSGRNRDSASKGIERRRTNSQPRCAPRRLGPRRCARRHLRMRVQADLGRGVRRCRRP